MFRYPDFNERHPRSLLRSVLWRAIGVVLLAIITYVFTRQWITTTLITVCHHAVFILVYYLHERFWNWTSWLRYSPAKPFVRMVFYETILGNLILGLISLAFTGEWQKATIITLVYIGNKHWMFILFDYLWARIKWGVHY